MITTSSAPENSIYLSSRGVLINQADKAISLRSQWHWVFIFILRGARNRLVLTGVQRDMDKFSRGHVVDSYKKVAFMIRTSVIPRFCRQGR